MIHLPTPCPKNWNKMTPVEGGRHCDACSKVIPDFSDKTEAEIIQAIQSGVTCGSFATSQVTDGSTYGGWKHFLNWKIGMAMLVAGSVFMASCSGASSRNRTTGFVATAQHKKITKGHKKKHKNQYKFFTDTESSQANK